MPKQLPLNNNLDLARAMDSQLRDLELQKIKHLEERYYQSNQENIVRETRAKMDLFDLDESVSDHPKRWSLPKKANFIKPWNADDTDEEENDGVLSPRKNHNNCPQQTYTPNRTARAGSNISRAKTYRQRPEPINENQNLIPQLKGILQRLESPERKKDSLKSLHNYQLDLLNDINKRRKHTMKVSDILKLQENWVSNPPSNPNSARPLTSAYDRLNTNHNAQAMYATQSMGFGHVSAQPASMQQIPQSSPVKVNPHHHSQTQFQEITPTRPTKLLMEQFKEEEVVRIIKKKRAEMASQKNAGTNSNNILCDKKEGAQSNLINYNAFGINSNPVAVNSVKREYSSFKREVRPREKLTLINLLQ